jgi:hypothetical protein
MATLLEEFKAIIEALDRAGIDYAVCGGWAMAIHGLLRSTIDIDLMLRAEDVERAISIARVNGYEVEGLPLSFDNGIFELRRISKIDKERRELVTLDFVLVTDAYKDVWENREDVDSQFGKLKVVSREGLVKMKLLAGREQDLLDIKKLKNDENEN